MDPPLVNVTDVVKTFPLRRRGGERQEVRALDGVSLTVRRGEYLSIMGPSGSGKSTLFNIIGALDVPTSGDVRIGDLSLPTLSSRQLAYVRGHHLGYIFQAYNLIASLTAVRNVALPRIFAGHSPQDAERVATAKLEQVGLGHRLTHRPGELSGGEQQRVALARALVLSPPLILADEPTGNLDTATSDA
ncbi:MAG: ABC transporter ATP-binding protein, partial [Planctomycetota bacterium]